MTQVDVNAYADTPQTEPIPGSGQVENSAGGHSWQVDRWTRLRRFLILGVEGGTYYTSERKLTVDNLTAVEECARDNGPRTVSEIINVSVNGRAPKQSPTLAALALVASRGDTTTRRIALDAVHDVCRTATHLFEFVGYCKQFRGWGRGLRTAVADWYRRDAGQVAYQAVKYRKRHGYTHRDLLRLAHPAPPTEAHQALYAWATQGRVSDRLPSIVTDYLELSAAGHPAQAAAVIREHPDLPREAVPTDHLTDPDVWAALLERMPLTAMIRNLGNMTKVGLLTPGSDAERTVVDALADDERIGKARVHPIQMLAALLTYQSGGGARGSGTWEPSTKVVDALDGGFYSSFGNVEPTGKRRLLALDISGSMSIGNVAGVPGLTPRVASAALALIAASTGDPYEVVGFARELTVLPISPRQRLDDVVRTISGLPFGGTDCAQPMLWADERSREFDVFEVYTDSETWAGRIHPTQALQRYRRSVPDARLAVVGMTASEFSIADPNDSGMLDVVGFDTATPNILSGFVRGDI